MKKVDCFMCGKSIEEDINTEYGQWRHCEVGLICVDCYPIYKKIIAAYGTYLRPFITKNVADLDNALNQILKEAD